MKLKISDIPEGVRHISPLNHKKIVVKTQAYDVEKFVLGDVGQALLHKMIVTCLLDDGVGLAAPQIGTFRRLFIIRDMDASRTLLNTFTLYFNPSFKALSNEKETDIEGCLSVPEGRFQVPRYVNIQATWWEPNAEGKLEKRESLMHGYEARVFQHELDHLNGVSIALRGSAKR